jgi:hypothetical protein
MIKHVAAFEQAKLVPIDMVRDGPVPFGNAGTTRHGRRIDQMEHQTSL